MPLPTPSRALRPGEAAPGLSLASTLVQSPSNAPYGRKLRSSRSTLPLVSAAVFKNNKKTNQSPKKTQNVSYGRDWYESTRDPSRGLTPREEMLRRRQANWEANNGLERKDLYTDNWAGSEYRGSAFNVLNVILFVSVAVPALGLLFAYKTYGVLWG